MPALGAPILWLENWLYDGQPSPGPSLVPGLCGEDRTTEDLLASGEIEVQSELAARLDFETLLADLSARFVNIPTESIDHEIAEAQRKLCVSLGIDRSTLFQGSPDGSGGLLLTHIYQPPDAPPPPKNLDARDYFPWVTQQAFSGKTLVIRRISDVPLHATRDRESFAHYRTKATLIFPLSVAGGPVFGVLAFASLQQEREWSEALITRCRVVAQVVGNALAYKRSQDELAARLVFETLLADLSARFVNLPSESVDSEIMEAERRICESLDLDISAVWQWSPGPENVFTLTHYYSVQDGPQPSMQLRDTDFPWFRQLMIDGRIVPISSLEHMPPEASLDRENCRRLGVKSNLCLPLSVGGKPVGLLGLNTTRAERAWPDALVKRLQLVAQIFANALARMRTEQALRGSEERYRAITLNLPGLVYQFYARDDGKWGLHYMDARAGDVCGLSPENLETFFDRFIACVAPECREGWLNSIRQAVSTLEQWDQEFRFIKPSGEELFLRAISEPRRLGSQVVFYGVMRDVTQQRRSQEELHRTLDELNRLKEQLQHENVYLRKEVEALQGQIPIVGSSASLSKAIAQAQQVAATDSTVLILGETGTGKELLAAYLHRIGRRSGKPFITTNIAAIPSTLLESELFGREKGAYTGALTKQIGRFEMADGGTLFLDEIGEMPMETQAKLLRVLQKGEFERLGSGQTLRANVQVIAATNRKLPDLIHDGRFRQDLYYRLNVFPITLPPLRDRPEDIPALVWAFVQELSERMGKPIDRIRRKDLEALQRYDWPGNVRELRNVVERSMIVADGPELRLTLPDAESGEPSAQSRALRDVERAHIQNVLKSAGGRIRGPHGAAEILGIKPPTLYAMMDRLGIDRTQ